MTAQDLLDVGDQILQILASPRPLHELQPLLARRAQGIAQLEKPVPPDLARLLLEQDQRLMGQAASRRRGMRQAGAYQARAGRANRFLNQAR